MGRAEIVLVLTNMRDDQARRAAAAREAQQHLLRVASESGAANTRISCSEFATAQAARAARCERAAEALAGALALIPAEHHAAIAAAPAS